MKGNRNLVFLPINEHPIFTAKYKKEIEGPFQGLITQYQVFDCDRY
jgi:hypothetical protein